MNACERCRKRGTPENFASEPKCAFPDGVFQPDNWQCATMNALRDLAYTGEGCAEALRVCDESIAVVPIVEDGDCMGFVVMTYYKDRGRTSRAVVMYENDEAPLTLEAAERCIASYEPTRPQATEGSDR